MDFDMLKENKLLVTDDAGQMTTYDVLCTFEDAETGKKYIVYTDNTRDESGKVQVYANAYENNETTGKMVLKDIETDDEWDLVEEALETIREEILPGPESND